MRTPFDRIATVSSCESESPLRGPLHGVFSLRGCAAGRQKRPAAQPENSLVGPGSPEKLRRPMAVMPHARGAVSAEKRLARAQGRGYFYMAHARRGLKKTPQH